jgi:hypothetical protein
LGAVSGGKFRLLAARGIALGVENFKFGHGVAEVVRQLGGKFRARTLLAAFDAAEVARIKIPDRFTDLMQRKRARQTEAS